MRKLTDLAQTCPGKDITLHVSVNNSAMILYQLFGFKVRNNSCFAWLQE
jgi:ribosomal protein S18 acetylase RimI-like enzyme